MFFLEENISECGHKVLLRGRQTTGGLGLYFRHMRGHTLK